MTNNETDDIDETYQDNTAPVQAFSTPVVSPGRESDTRSRRNRPTRVNAEIPSDSSDIAATVQNGSQAMTESSERRQ
jgi:hypothetical protein